MTSSVPEITRREVTNSGAVRSIEEIGDVLRCLSLWHLHARGHAHARHAGHWRHGLLRSRLDAGLHRCLARMRSRTSACPGSVGAGGQCARRACSGFESAGDARGASSPRGVFVRERCPLAWRHARHVPHLRSRRQLPAERVARHAHMVRTAQVLPHRLPRNALFIWHKADPGWPVGDRHNPVADDLAGPWHFLCCINQFLVPMFLTAHHPHPRRSPT